MKKLVAILFIFIFTISIYSGCTTNLTTCYQCKSGIEITSFFNGSCPTGWYPTHQSCSIVTSDRIQKMSICYSGRIFLTAQQQYIAQHFDLVDTDPKAGSIIQSMKAINPDLKAIGYYDAIFESQSVSHPEDWYVHGTGSSTRITHSSGINYLMNVNPNVGWMNYYITRAMNLDSVYDGIFLDDYWHDPAYDNEYWSVLPSSWEVSMSNWKTWMVQFAGNVKSNLGNKIAMANVPPSSGAIPLITDQTHAMLFEHFVHKLGTSVTENGRTVASIQSSISLLNSQAKKGDIIAVVGGCNAGTGYEDWAKFTWVCFAFAVEDPSKAYFAWNFMGSSPTTNPTWFQWMDTEIGQPMGDYYLVKTPYVYGREFTNCYLIANLNSLGTGAVSFVINGHSVSLDGKKAVIIEK